MSLSERKQNVSALKEFLEEVFGSLEATQTEYCLLRNHEDLPATVPGTDIDMLVAPNHAASVVHRLLDVGKKHGFLALSMYRKHLRILHVKLWNPASAVCLRFDIITSIGSVAFESFTAGRVLSNRISHRGFHVLPAPMEAAVTVVQNWLSPGAHLKEKYIHQIRGFSEAERGQFFALLAREVGEERMLLFTQCLIAGAPSVQKMIQETRRQLWLWVAVRSPLRTLFNAASFVRTSMERALRPPGRFIVLLGPDGSGKSTVAKRLVVALEKFYPNVVLEHLYPKVLPRLRDVRQKINTGGNDRPESEWQRRSRKVGFIKSFISLCYYTFVYISGYWLAIYPHLVKGSLVVYDRYCYDYITDPSSKGVNLPRWLIRTFLMLVPKPDTVLFVYCDAHVAHQRKNEIPPEEIHRQIVELRALGTSIKKFIEIDNSKEISETILQAVRAVESAQAVARVVI